METGISERGYLIHPHKGTPQGGIISPLLANIALNEFDHLFNPNNTLDTNDIRKHIITIRYADDFIVISKEKAILTRIYSLMQKYFERIGLQFNRDKTRINTRATGFDFLGFHFIQYL